MQQASSPKSLVAKAVLNIARSSTGVTCLKVQQATQAVQFMQTAYVEAELKLLT